MKNITTIMITVILFFCKLKCFSLGLSDNVLMIKLSNEFHWKKNVQSLSEEEFLLELIPQNQTSMNWNECIDLQSIDLTKFRKKASIKNIISCIKDEVFSTYPEFKLSWKILEENENDVIYEWQLHEPHNRIPPQHEICGGFLRNNIFHRVGYTRKHSSIEKEEKDKWINLFKTSTSFISIEDTLKSSEGLSSVSDLHPSIDFPHPVSEPDLEFIRKIVQRKDSHICGDIKLEVKMLSDEEIINFLNLDYKKLQDMQVVAPYAYLLKIKDFPAGATFRLYTMNMEYSLLSLVDYINHQFITPDKKFRIIKSNKDFSIFFCGGFMNGEPQHIVLISEDKKITLATEIVPNPIECNWKDGSKFSVKMCDRWATQFEFKGQGFQPHECVTLESISGEDKLICKHKADEKGQFHGGLMPAVSNRKGGEVEIKLTRPNDTEMGIVYFHWGTAARKNAKVSLKDKPLR